MTHFLVDDSDGGVVRLEDEEIVADFVKDGWRETTQAEYEQMRRKIWGSMYTPSRRLEPKA